MDVLLRTAAVPLTALLLVGLVVPFPGVLRSWSDKPAYLDDRGLLCAVLVVPPSGPAELFVDFRARRNHMHLSSDAGNLVAAARRGQIDHGWSALPDGSLATGIGARRVFEELG